MKPTSPPRRRTLLIIVGAAAALAIVIVLALSGGKPPEEPAPAAGAAAAEPSVDLAPSQLNAIVIAPVGTHLFPIEKQAVGSIDYDEDRSVQVFPPYQGKILTAFANLGDAVRQGQPLYTIDSPDLVQAESTLIGAAATYALTSKELARAKDLSGPNGVSQREAEQAASDAQTAEGALRAARAAVRMFGKTEAEINQVVASRKIDSILVVASPVTGQVTSRNAQPGLLVQPGNAPAPYAVADLSTKWLVAYVSEGDSPSVQLGQPLEANVTAYPGRVFQGRISQLGTAVDPNTHRLTVRSEIADPQNELRPGMLAGFSIQTGDPVESVALPMNGVVRNGDGTMAAWVTTDRHRFFQRIVKLGRQRDGLDQILDGLRPGELAVTDGAVFLSNILYAPPTD